MMQLLLSNPPKRKRRRKVAKASAKARRHSTNKVRRRRHRTFRRIGTVVKKGASPIMAKRHSRSRRRRVVARASRRRGSFTRKSGFVDKELLVAAGATAAGFILPNMLLDRLATVGVNAATGKGPLDAIKDGYGRIAAKAGLGLAVAHFGRKYNPKLAMAFGIGAIASAAVDAYNVYQVSRILAASGGSTVNTALTSGGIAGYDEALPFGEGVGGYESPILRYG